MNQHRKRESLIISVCLFAGVLAASLVYIGDKFEWPNFSNRQGYFGTEFMSGILYAINDPYAIHIVAVLWFLYGAVPLYVFLSLIRRMSRRDRA